MATRKLFTLLLSLSLLVLAGASTASAKKVKNNKPKWVDNPVSVYPESQYISALGAGDTRQAAESNATGNLTKRFKVKIDVDETMTRRYQALTNMAGSMDESLSEEELKNIKSSSSETLMDVQFSESYTDDMGRVNLVAYLDRRKTGDLYSERLDNNFAKIRQFLEKGQALSDLPTQYAYYNAAFAVSQINENMIAQLDIISPSHKNRLIADDDIRYIAVSDLLNKTAAKIGFKVNISGDDDEKITVQVQQAISQLGFQLSPDPILSVNGTVAYELLDLKRDNLVFVGWQLDLKLTDNTGKVLISLVERGREGGLDEATARRNAVKQMAKIIKKRFQKDLTNYFDRLIMDK